MDPTRRRVVVHRIAYKSCSLLLVLAFSLSIRSFPARGQDLPEPPFSYQFIRLDLASLDVFGLDYAKVAWGDQDLDGDLDMLLSGYTSQGPKTTVFMNLVEEEFVEDSVLQWRHYYGSRSTGITPLWLGDIAWIDFNNDGLLEFAISGSSTSEQPFALETKIYAPFGTTYGALPDIHLVGVAGGSMDWGDFDNDGDPDLILTGQDDATIYTRLYKNDNGSLTDSGIRLPLTSVGDAKFGDYDGDGDLDLILTAVHTAEGFATALLRNDGGTFTEVETNLPGLIFSSVDWGDYDNDGDLDLLFSGGVLSPLVVYERSRVFRNDGQDRFTDVEAALDDAAFGTAKWGDYDNDGYLDVVIAGGKGAAGAPMTRFYRYQSDDVFVPALNLAGIRNGGLGFGDYDGDGDLDVVVAGTGRLVQYRNDHRRVNNAPGAPTNLKAVQSEDGLILAWDASTDVETPSAGLTYNIRVGTEPKSLDVISPMSHVDTGRRLVAEMGNVQNNTSWLVRNLPTGTYYWSVQSVDHSFQASSWAEEASFDVGTSNNAATALEPNELPSDLDVGAVYPNPFDPTRGGATIEIAVAEPQIVRIDVFSALGVHVATLAERTLTSGTHHIVWDGQSMNGQPVVPGVYFVRLAGQHHSKTIRLVRSGS